MTIGCYCPLGALYALFVGESDVGLNGLEQALRNIWAHEVRIDRAQVHRKGLSLVVVWTDGVAQETWEAVNRVAVERLNAF